jgi:hypothetical protein
MRTRLWCGLVALVATATWSLPATAFAQARQRYPTNAPSTQSAYDAGYRTGLIRGDRDGRAGAQFGYDRDQAYRRGDMGWGGQGNREVYRSAFRRGYADGYRTGYSRVARNTPDARGEWLGNRLPGYGWGAGRYAAGPGFDRGFRDGYDEGRDAGRDNDRYDPQRENDYRDADNGYSRRYGTKDYYKQTYRDGFLSGYDRGYREGQYSRDRRW